MAETVRKVLAPALSLNHPPRGSVDVRGVHDARLVGRQQRVQRSLLCAVNRRPDPLCASRGPLAVARQARGGRVGQHGPGEVALHAG